MRLDFNYAIIDDDFIDEDDSWEVEQLIKKINENIEDKGFKPICKRYKSKRDFENSITREDISPNRIDLYISDNNLGNNTHINDRGKKDVGIDIYLDLKDTLICDFILYTRASTSSIVKRLSDYLLEKQNPGIFSRFTFVPRSANNTVWHQEVVQVIDHILTKREEINNLRGLYAQYVSRIDLMIKDKFNRDNQETLEESINSINKKHFTSNFPKAFLHNIRTIRNSLLHNDEEYCKINNEFIIYFKVGKNPKGGIIKESELKKYRKFLYEAYDFVNTLQP